MTCITGNQTLVPYLWSRNNNYDIYKQRLILPNINAFTCSTICFHLRESVSVKIGEAGEIRVWVNKVGVSISEISEQLTASLSVITRKQDHWQVMVQ